MTGFPPPEAGEWVWRPSMRSPLDETVNALERKWGIGRLPRLVSPETAARFATASDMHGAGPTHTHTAAQLDAMMARAWAALDAEATQRGASTLPAAIHEIPLDGVPGAVAAICRDDDHAHAIALRAKAEGRTVSTWTLAECVRVIQANELVNVIKDRFPGATVQPRQVGAMPEDEIPFGDHADAAE